MSLNLENHPMGLPASVAEIVGRARRRMFVSGLAHLVVVLAGVASVAAAVLLAVARLVVIPWA